MPLIPRADAAVVARDAVVLDLGDLARQGRSIVQRAEDEAARIIGEAQAERERLIAGATEQGFAEGFEKGRAEGHAEGIEAGKAEAVTSSVARLDQLQSAWERALARFESMQAGARLEAERGVLALAVRLGERVAKRAIEADAEAAVHQLAEAIELFMAPSRLVVRVARADVELVRQALPALSDRLHDSPSITVIEDQTLSHGSVIVESDQTRIDATIETQLQRIIDALMPGEAS